MKFDGTVATPIETWMADFEDMAYLMHWSDLQKVIYAKKALTGMAKTFIQGERGLNSWRSLRAALLDEFRTEKNSAEIHRALGNRKLKEGEDLLEYFLEMKKIARVGDVEDTALIQYVIDGIPETDYKIMLYGARDIRELKEKLRLYQSVRDRKGVKKDVGREKKEGKSKGEGKESQTDRCYDCGALGHRSAQCKVGLKCFKCKGMGHKSFECPNNKSGRDGNQTVPERIQVMRIESKMRKTLKIQDREVAALIDTGSQVNIMRADTHKILGSPKLARTTTRFEGFGSSKIRSLGYFSADVEADDIVLTGQRFHVVPKHAMNDEAIMGIELLDQVELAINKDGIRFKKAAEPDRDDRDQLILGVSTVVEESLDIGTRDPERRKLVEDLVRAYVPTKTKTTDARMKIILKDEEPVYQTPSRLPFAERDVVDQQVEKGIEEGIVKPCNSEYASRVMVVKKKDGTPRSCIDRLEVQRKDFEHSRDLLRKKAKEQIGKIKEENRRRYNLRRREPTKYEVGELVAVKRTQTGPELKLKTKFLGPYRIVRVKGHDTYDVEKVGFHEGPNKTTTCAEYMKRWGSARGGHLAGMAECGRWQRRALGNCKATKTIREQMLMVACRQTSSSRKKK
ncbi:UNVERIFIED_CONTAM: hypothetical protein PYX00_005850 [Menopon gallinae]|uniref:CCHC-type domain-containing protein n=1 Tax=Menopon gallinae TaxID=328185 RepID=A0AAW2HUV8_9NEOP